VEVAELVAGTEEEGRVFGGGRQGEAKV
jgi:hypothetical protein